VTPALHDLIVERLVDDKAVDSRVVTLVDAACDGQSKLEEALAELRGSERQQREPVARPSRVAPPGAYLKLIELGGFRGVGQQQKLELEPGPGLTLLLGRNGSGKSSFAEGLEALLTGQSRRWLSRPKDWERGWKNLHTTERSFVAATFYVEGSKPIDVRRTWQQGDELEDGELRVRRGSERLGGLDVLGWQEPLTTSR
jgi:hypothetical protein